MAKLKIVTDEEKLRMKSKIVFAFDRRLSDLLDDMNETLTVAHGVGIAAVQVGVLYRACVICTKNGMLEIINPQVIEERDIKAGEEGCLSIPKAYGIVRRPRSITLRAQDRNGKMSTYTLEGAEAVCVSHEIDHMDGILFTDKIVIGEGGKK